MPVVRARDAFYQRHLSDGINYSRALRLLKEIDDARPSERASVSEIAAKSEKSCLISEIMLCIIVGHVLLRDLAL